ncbi:MAG TPA: cytochrome c [Dongiaceae bacterium]|jgi:cytochrome c556
MLSLSKNAWVRGVTTVAIVFTLGATAWAADDIIKTRQSNMKAMGGALKTIKGVIDANGNAADVVAPANKIAEIAGKIPSLFPAGSDKGKTGANPNIWTDAAGFKADADALQNQAQMLASAGQSGDLATVRAQFDKVAGACGTCHKTYRHKTD